MQARFAHPYLGVLAAVAIVGGGATAHAGTIEGTVSARHNKDVVVYVAQAPGNFPPPKKNPTIDQKRMAFVPHILPVLQGTTVDFFNSDHVNHNVFSPDHEGYNLGTWPHGEHRSYTFKHLGAYTQLCSLHPEMEGYVIVLQNPYYAISNSKGHYVIKNVPKGHYVLKVWGEKLHKKDKKRGFPVDVSAGKTTANINL